MKMIKGSISQWQYTYNSTRFLSNHINSSSVLLVDLYGSFYRLKSLIECVKWKQLYPGSIYCSIDFIHPYPRVIDYEVLTLAFIILIELYAYNVDSDYVKFTIGYHMQLPYSQEISFTLDKAIPLCDHLGNRLPKRVIYDKIENVLKLYAELYQDAEIKGVFIRIYYDKDSVKSELLNFPEISDDILINIRNVMESDIGSIEIPDVKSLSKMNKEKRIPTQIKAIKKGKVKKCRPFIVADLETIIVNSAHVPYAVGYCVVHPGDDFHTIIFNPNLFQ